MSNKIQIAVSPGQVWEAIRARLVRLLGREPKIHEIYEVYRKEHGGQS